MDTTCSELPFASTGPEGWSAPGYSRVRLVLQPGFHRIRIRSLRSPFGASTGFIYIYRIGENRQGGQTPNAGRDTLVAVQFGV